MNPQFSIKDLLKPVTNDLVCSGEDTLGSILPGLKDITDIRLVFDSNDNFLGILNTYQSLYKNPHPFTTKSKHAALKPQAINLDNSLFEIAAYMASQQIYTLPVFDGEKVVGVIKAHDLLYELQKDDDLLQALSDTLTFSPVISVGASDTVRHVYTELKQSGIIAAIMQDSSGNLKGLVDRNDLKAALILPINKQRFGKNGRPPTDRAFDEEPFDGLGEPVSKYLRPNILVEDAGLPKSELINKLLTSRQSILFIKSKNSKTPGSISLGNLLEVFASLKMEKSVNIMIKKPGSNVHETEYKKAYRHLEDFASMINKRLPLERIEVTVEEPKHPDQSTAIFNTTLILIPLGKGHYVAQSKAGTYTQGLKSAIKQVEKQIRRDRSYIRKSQKSLSENTMDVLQSG